MKNAATPRSAIPPATDNPTMDPVPSPELESASWLLLGDGVAVGEASVFETCTVTTITVGEPSAPVLSMLLSLGGTGADVAWGGGVVEVESCFNEVRGGSEVVEVEVGVPGAGLEGCEGSFVCDVVVVVESFDSTGTDGTIDEREF